MLDSNQVLQRRGGHHGIPSSTAFLVAAPLSCFVRQMAMSNPIPKSGDTSAGPRTQLGEVEAVFLPSPGQMTAGVIAGFGIVTAGLLLALFGGDGPIGSRVAVAAVPAVLGIGLVYWIWRLRRWKLLICADGVVQTGAWGSQALRWVDVIEVVETRPESSPNGPAIAVRIVGRAGKIKINTINIRTWRQMLSVVLEAARRHDLPIRVELQASGD